MGSLTKDKRDRIEKLVLGVVERMDNKAKKNVEMYKVLFKNMDDKEFEVWANSMGHDLDDTIQMFQLPFEEMKMTQIKDAADFLKIPLEEYVWFRHNDPNGIRTKTKVPVGLI